MNSRCKYFPSVLILLVLLFCAAGPAGARFADLANRATNCGVSEGAVSLARKVSDSDGGSSAVLGPLLDACVEQFPIKAFENKLAEGVAKHVPSAVIARALNTKLAAYRFGRELLLTSVGKLDAAALEAVAQGVERGVPMALYEKYARIFAGKPSDMFQTGLDMLSLQTQVDFPPDLTMAIVGRGVRAETLTSGWRHFVRVIILARKAGLEDNAISDAAIKVLGEEGEVSDVLPELGFTGRDLGGE